MPAERLFQGVAVQVLKHGRKVLTDGARFRATLNTSLSVIRRCSRKMMMRRYEVAPDSSTSTVNRRSGASG